MSSRESKSAAQKAYNSHMPSLTLSEINNPDQIKAWIDAGETIELHESDRVVARIVPAWQPPPADKWPDFGAETRAIFGDRILPGADLLIEERENSRF
jgi:antitoxin (DNA-binding transcriptional repressor) of toxin-antitoxin stability system